jgi:protein-glutamine gamma-glutamyltransferase
MVKIKTVLSALSLCIALTGYLPLQPYLDPVARFFFPGALLLGVYLQLKDRALPGKILTPFSILIFLYFASGFSMSNIIQITADLLVVFLGIRMLGERSSRHYLQVFALALFCLAASSVYNLSALFLVYLLLLLLLLAVSLVVLAFHAHDPEIALERVEAKKVLTVSSLLPVAALPILLFLFILLPRTQYPLWDFLNRSGPKVTGFSDTIRPGGSSSVSEVKNAVLRVVSRRVPDDRLYWRGIVLNGFNGNDWVRLPTPDEQPLRIGKGEAVHQEIYPEPTRNPYLLALNIPRSIRGVRSSEAEDTVFSTQRPLEKRVKYEAESTLSDAIIMKELDRGFYLTLPQSVPERVRAQGGEIARSGSSAADKLRLVEQFFRSQRISYATTDLPVGPDPIDSFLFVKKRGHCELFASSCATLLRVAGVPARLVGGYRGGTYNDMGGYYLVTEDMAHVWVEAYIDGRGWVSVDPSAWSIGFARNEGVARKLRMYMDAVGFYWNKAVLTYDLEKQLTLISSAGGKARNLRLPAGWWRPVLPVAAAALLLAAMVTLYRKGPKSREERVLKRFLRAVRRRYPAGDAEGTGLFELAEKVPDPRVREFVNIYAGAIYGDRRLRREELAQLREIIRSLEEHPA